MQLKNEVIPGSKNLPICLDVFFEANETAKPIVILVHGFKGFKDWGHFNEMGNLFSEKGFVFVKFNFSHNGTTPDKPDEFTDLEAFGHNNYLIELDDLKKVIDWILHSSKLKHEIDPERIYLIGHSRGGGIAVLKAHEDKRIKKLVTWASVCDFINRNKKRTIETWKNEGVIYAANSRTGQQMPMYVQFYDIMMANKDRLNILRAAKHLKIPYLIIHGTNDEAVPFHEAESLHKSAHHSKLLAIKDSGHTFAVTHPFKQDLPADAKLVLDATINFLLSH